MSATPRILVIEDSATLAKLALKSLERAGYTPDHALNGADALRIIDERCPDLILLDLTLPDMNGWQVLEYAQEKHGLTGDQVIVLTTQDDAVNRTAGRLHTVQYYLIKPVMPDALIEVVNEALGAMNAI